MFVNSPKIKKEIYVQKEKRTEISFSIFWVQLYMPNKNGTQAIFQALWASRTFFQIVGPVLDSKFKKRGKFDEFQTRLNP